MTHPWLRSDVTVPEHDAVCEQCGAHLFAAYGHKWEEQRARDADGETTITICERCIDAAQAEADAQYLRRAV